jgi:predicted kinase
VIIDAVFGRAEKRLPFVKAAKRLGLPVLFLVCVAGGDTIRTRLEHRHADPSDADWSVHQEAAKKWDAPIPGSFIEIDMNGSPQSGVQAALRALGAEELW